MKNKNKLFNNVLPILAISLVGIAAVFSGSSMSKNIVNAESLSCSNAEHGHTFNVEGNTLTISTTGTNTVLDQMCGLENYLKLNSSITKVIIGEGITKVDGYVFQNCTNITSVSFPSTLETIDYYAFDFCTCLSEIEFKSTTCPTIYFTTFRNVANSGTITVPVGKITEYENGLAGSLAGFDETTWDIVEYSDNAKFDDGFKNKNITSDSYVVGNSYTVHDDVKYTFAGWYDNQLYTGEAVTTFANNTTYYAKWTNSFNNVVVTSSVNYKKTPVSTLPDGTGISWNAENKTVTLNNATIDTKEQVALNLPADSTVTANGENYVAAMGNGDTNYKKCVGIYSDQVGSLTINGSGSLKAYGGDLISGSNNHYYGVMRLSAGIYANGDINVSNIELYSKSGKTNYEENESRYLCGYTYGICSTKKVTIDNAKVTSIADDATITDKNGFSIGIRSYNNVEITNSTVNTSSGKARQDTAGIYAGYYFDSYSEVTAYGPNDCYVANVIINKSTVTATSGTTVDYDTIGIYAHNDIQIVDSNVTAKNSGPRGADDEDGETRAAGIFHNQDLVIDNSKVAIEAYGDGIYTYVHVDEVNEGKDVVFGKTDIKNNSSVTITTLDNDGAALTACNKLCVDKSVLTCNVKAGNQNAIVFNDPNHSKDTIDGFTLVEPAKIVTNGTIKVGETDEDNPYYFGNASDKNYDVIGCSTITKLDGSKNVITPDEGKNVIIAFTYSLEYNMNSLGSQIDSETVISGDKLVKPNDPTCKGYSFEGWFKDEACTQSWDFDNDVVTGNTTLYAKWSKNVSVALIVILILLLLLIIYIIGYFALYRRGKLDESGIKVIYAWLPRGNKGKEEETNNK